jgi:tRNA nucleotidyltransferase (CCA-adding enzyme)
VRDVLLGHPPGPDLDLVVEGDALALARRLGRVLGATVTVHERFGTAELELPHGRRVDVAMARRERYPAPGALPDVAPGSLADDLARRDFTVNAMAFRLSGPDAGRLVDPHGGRRDLDDGVLRALRDDAFAEDPSRLTRAARYAARLDLVLEPGTSRAARAAADDLDPGSARVADELRRLLGEPSAPRAVAILAGLGVPWLALAPPAAELALRVAALDDALARTGAPSVPAWALRLGLVADERTLARLAVPAWAAGVAAEARRGPGLAAALTGDPRPSEVDALLAAAPPATAVAALAEGAEPVARWWAEWRDLRPAVGGAELVAAGIRPGPAIGRALRRLRAAVLDGETADREAQLALALEEARR